MVGASFPEYYGTCIPYEWGRSLQHGSRRAHETLDAVEKLIVWGTKIDRGGLDCAIIPTEKDVPSGDLSLI